MIRLRGTPARVRAGLARLAVVLLALSSQSAAETVLAPGDLAIIQYRTGKGDGFSFVALVDIEPQTRIHFTDKGWFGSGLCRSENVWTWEAPPGGLSKGSVANMSIGKGLNGEDGDQIIAFQGTPESPRFIYALSTRPWITTGDITASTSYLPAGLVNGDTARDFPKHRKNGFFKVARVSGTPEEIRAAIGTVSKWHLSDEATAPFHAPSEWSFAVSPPVASTLSIAVAPSTKPFVRLPAQRMGYVCASVNDPTDPAAFKGIDFVVSGADLNQVKVRVADEPVPGKPYAPPELTLSGEGKAWTLNVSPSGQGFAQIRVHVTNGPASARYELLYASSTNYTTSSNTRHHTHSSDASTVVPAGPLHMLVGDDEDEIIRLYHRYESGAPIAEFDLAPHLNLKDRKYGHPREVDIEGATEVGRRVYWIGSHGNSKSGKYRSNRSRIFSTDRLGVGSKTTLSYVGHYEGLREDLLAWDTSGGHGLGAGYFGLAASAHAAMKGGVEPKRPDGFNIEALAMLPDSTTDSFIGFRAPLVPPGDRRFALVVVVSNLTKMVDSSAPAGSARFGAPILFDLGGRGIRSMERNAANEYLIVAGPPGVSEAFEEDFQFYYWNGQPDTPPRLLQTDLAAAGLAGAIEGIVEVPSNLLTNAVHVVLDQGATEWFGDGRTAKEHTKELRKFVSGPVVFRPVQEGDEYAR